MISDGLLDVTASRRRIGLVRFALAKRGLSTFGEQQLFPGDRTAVRIAIAERAFALIRARL